MRLRQVLADRHHARDAVEDLEVARQIKPTGAILDRLARSYYELGYNDKALPVIEQALKSSPNNATLLLLQTNILLNLGAESKSDSQKAANYKKALASAEAFRDVKPNDKDAQNMVGRAALVSAVVGSVVGLVAGAIALVEWPL